MLRKIFRETVRANGMDKLMQETGAVIAAFSGGADSSALVLLLSEYASEMGIPLILAHVNHMIRGEEADGDERFVRQTAEKLKAALHVKKADVPALAKEWAMGLEEAARKVRYDFFEELSKQYGNAPVATAHNSDDNLETVLFHIMRGSGLKGLCGISPVRDGKYIRPIIACSAKDIRTFCQTEGILYRTDSTNSDTDYSRNFIRHRIVPAIEELCDSPQGAVLRMTELLRRDSDYLESEADRLCPKGTLSFDRCRFNALPPALSSRILRNMYASCVGDCDSVPSALQTDAMLSLAASEKREGSLSLPCGISLRVTRKELFFTRGELEENNGNGEISLFPMDPNGSVFENKRYKILVSPKEHKDCTQEQENIYKLAIHRLLYSDKIIGTLYIKYRNRGDTYRYGGFTRKIKKLMIDRKLTAEEKKLYPLLCDDEGILWMPPYPLRDGAEGADSGKQIIHLYFFEKKDKKEIDDGTQGSIGTGY